MSSVPTIPAVDEVDLVVDEIDLATVTDPWERARLADELAAQLQARRAEVLGVRRDAVLELVLRRGEKQNRVAQYLRKSPARINQIVVSLRAPAAEVA